MLLLVYNVSADTSIKANSESRAKYLAEAPNSLLYSTPCEHSSPPSSSSPQQHTRRT